MAPQPWRTASRSCEGHFGEELAALLADDPRSPWQAGAPAADDRAETRWRYGVDGKEAAAPTKDALGMAGASDATRTTTPSSTGDWRTKRWLLVAAGRSGLR